MVKNQQEMALLVCGCRSKNRCTLFYRPFADSQSVGLPGIFAETHTSGQNPFGNDDQWLEVVYFFTIQSESRQAPIEKIIPDAKEMPFYHLLNYPFASHSKPILSDVNPLKLPDVNPLEEMATKPLEMSNDFFKTGQ